MTLSEPCQFNPNKYLSNHVSKTQTSLFTFLGLCGVCVWLLGTRVKVLFIRLCSLIITSINFTPDAFLWIPFSVFRICFSLKWLQSVIIFTVVVSLMLPKNRENFPTLAFILEGSLSGFGLSGGAVVGAVASQHLCLVGKPKRGRKYEKKKVEEARILKVCLLD